MKQGIEVAARDPEIGRLYSQRARGINDDLALFGCRPPQLSGHEDQSLVLRHVGDLDPRGEDITLQGPRQDLTEVALEVGEQSVRRGDNLEVTQHAAVWREHRGVTRLALGDVLERLAQDLIKEPGSLRSGHSQLAAMGAVDDTIGKGRSLWHDPIVPSPKRPP